VRTAYQGEPGAYSEAAALEVHPDTDLMPCPSFEAVFDAVKTGVTTDGVIPLENTIGGSIHRNFDLLVEHDLSIVGEVEIAVEHCLLVNPGTTRSAIRRVYSHPQGLAQCEMFLRAMEGVEIVATYDTAGSAKLVRDGQFPDAAAIASRRAADVFGLEVLESGIQDYAMNITRFAVIARQPDPSVLGEKTTIVFALPNEPGSLYRALGVFAERQIDLTKLESRPIRGRAWEYMFYADLALGRHELKCARALVHLAEFAKWIRTLGSYPRWKEAGK
jgi:prephenate dehydratase